MLCPACSHENAPGQKFCGECGTRLESTPVREERKVITALFCDLVGSTALGERLDEEDVAHLLHEYQVICRASLRSRLGDANEALYKTRACLLTTRGTAIVLTRTVADLAKSTSQIRNRT